MTPDPANTVLLPCGHVVDLRDGELYEATYRLDAEGHVTMHPTPSAVEHLATCPGVAETPSRDDAPPSGGT